MKTLSKKIFPNSKLARILIYLTSFFIFCFLFIELSIVFIVKSEMMKNKVEQILTENLQTQVNIGSMSWNFGHFYLKDLTIDTQNPFINLKTLEIDFNLTKLLKLDVDIESILFDGLTINIIKDKDGKFNFEQDLKKLEEKLEEENIPPLQSVIDFFNNPPNLPVDIFFHILQLHNIQIYFTDDGNNLNLALQNTSLEFDKLNIKEPFRISFYTDLFFDNTYVQIKRFPIAFNLYMHLKDFDFSKATSRINSLILSNNGTLFTIDLKLDNYKNPHLILEAVGTNFTNKFIEPLNNLPDFVIPQINLNADLDFNLDTLFLKLNSLKFITSFSNTSAEGDINLLDKITYKIKSDTTIYLDKLNQTTTLISDFEPNGKVLANVNLTENDLIAKIDLQDVSANNKTYFGNIKNLNGKIEVKSIKDIEISNINALLNGNRLDLSAKYHETQDKALLEASLKAKKLYLSYDTKTLFGKKNKDIDKKVNNQNKQENLEGKTEENQEQKSLLHNWKLPPLTTKIKVDIKDLKAPSINGKDVKFTLNLDNVQSDLSKANGKLILETKKGKIKDIYTLTEANIVVKSLFVSLQAISTVFNALDVFDILNALTSVFKTNNDADDDDENYIPNDNTTETQQNTQGENQNQAIDNTTKKTKSNGNMSYEDISFTLKLKDGITNFEKGIFTSKLFSCQINGDVDLHKQTLDLVVNTAPGNHPENGTMPLTIKINGSLQDPKGSLSLIGSVGSLLKSVVTDNPASSLLKGVFGIFSSKKQEPTDDDEIEESKKDTQTNNQEDQKTK